jgi:hypothetical protein
MSRLQGGVYIANPNGLRGDIFSAEGNENKLVMRMRGSDGADIPVDDSEMVEYTTDLSSEQTSTSKEEEDFRYYLYQKAQTCDDFYLHERILAIELGDDFTYLVLSNSAGENPLPHDIEGQALVRLVEAYFIGHGNVVGANGRHLTSFHKALRPFWKEESGGFSKLSGKTSGDILEQLQNIFSTEGANSGLLFFRAFCYAHHRLDYHKQEEKDSLLDAYCVTFYVVKLLQGKIKDMNMGITSLIEEEFAKYKSQDIDMTVEDLLWCFSILLLRIGSDVRRYKGLSVYNYMFPDPFDLTMNEELVVCQLAMELRPDSPVSFLSAYRMVMDTKAIVPQPLRFEWMKFAYEYAVRGLYASDHWNDPFFQYTFHSIVAYWLPTTTHAPSPYSLAGIDSRLKIANEFKREGKEYVPEYMLWMGQQHEFSVQNVLKPFRIMDKDTELTVPLIDSFTYKPVGMNGTSGGPARNNACAHCSKPVQRRLQCSRCEKVHYCSKPCQVAHWKESHNKVCTPKTPWSEECGNCSKTLQKVLKCSKCGQVNYCNRECQLDHWKGGHKQDCRKSVAGKVAS